MLRFTMSVSIALATLVPGPARAQDAMPTPSPAPEIDAFDPMLGDWEGGGTFIASPGAPPMRWSGVSSVQKILGGHFVQEDTRIAVGGAVLTMRYIYGYDPERGELFSHGLSNMGCDTVTVRWTDDHTLVATNSGVGEDGLPFVERWSTRYRGDARSFKMERGAGEEPVFLHVAGDWKRSKKTFDAARDGEASAQPSDEMDRLRGMLGRYRVTGEVTMSPGAPAMQITGDETSSWLFEGAVIHTTVHGQPGDYEAHAYLYYDPRARCYKHFAVNNMGMAGVSQARFWNDDLVFTLADPVMGTPGAERMVLKMDESGARTSIVSWRLAGTADPYKSFDATYEKVEDAAAEAEPESRFKPGSCCARAEAAGGSCTHPCCVDAAKKGEVCARCNK